MSLDDGAPAAPEPAIEINNLSYSFPGGNHGLKDVTLDLPPGSRTLLIGANGAGKTTLLRLLAGKRMSPPGTIKTLSLDPFTTTPAGITYLGVEWVLQPAVRTDIAVPELLASVGGDAYPSRRDELVRILDVDPAWRMHAVSDGERRRVQLAMGLIRPWAVLLLDEITVDLDLLSRRRFLGWLQAETGRGGGAVVYATHILDNLAGWPTHLVHLSLGRVKRWGRVEGFEREMRGEGTVASANSVLGELVLSWLEEDLAERGPRRGNVGMSLGVRDGIGGYGMEKGFGR